MAIAVFAGKASNFPSKFPDIREITPETGSRNLHAPPPSLPKPATDSSLAERPFCGHFSRVVVSDFRSLRGDIVFRPLLARQSLAAKIPFQTRIGQADRKSARGECGVALLKSSEHTGRRSCPCRPRPKGAGARSCVLESVGRRYGYFLFFFLRIVKFATDAREKALRLPPGPEQEDMLRKASLADIASHLDGWIGSLELQPPK